MEVKVSGVRFGVFWGLGFRVQKSGRVQGKGVCGRSA